MQKQVGEGRHGRAQGHWVAVLVFWLWKVVAQPCQVATQKTQFLSLEALGGFWLGIVFGLFGGSLCANDG